MNTYDVVSVQLTICKNMKVKLFFDICELEIENTEPILSYKCHTYIADINTIVIAKEVCIKHDCIEEVECEASFNIKYALGNIIDKIYNFKDYLLNISKSNKININDCIKYNILKETYENAEIMNEIDTLYTDNIDGIVIKLLETIKNGGR